MSLYDILNVHKNSSKIEIEKAYKNRAKKVHPIVSRKGDKEFVELNRAYNILKDPYKKDFYDMMGDNVIDHLDREKESYVMVRVFDRINITCYLLFFIGLVSNILLIPIGLFIDLIYLNLYIFIGLLIFLVIPIIRNIFRVDFLTYRQIFHLSLRYAILACLVNTNSKLIFTGMVVVDILNILTMQNCLSLIGVIGFYISFLINLSCLILIKAIDNRRISSVLVYAILHFYLYFNQIRMLMTGFIVFLFLYFLPIIFISFEIYNKLVFIPLGLLIFGFVLACIIFIKFIKLNMPKLNLNTKSLESLV